jgi:cellulose synthase/poly-beta-1,6-N-acetylglucosamine synthase-like glycosyltransferase
LPVYFIYKLGINFLVFYLIIVITYSILFLFLICPFCAIRDICPAGKVSSNISKKFNLKC